VSTVIVYVHGLWQRGAEGHWLRRRLARDLAADVRAFSYPSVTADATANTRALAEYLSAIRADTLHLIGHSLGGLVIVKLFEEHAETVVRLPPGRIVLLGSPMRGSRTARNLARLPFGRKIMGLAVGEELLVPRERRWGRQRDLGVIAGDLGFGLGRLVGTLGGCQRRYDLGRGDSDRGRGGPGGVEGQSHWNGVLRGGGARGGRFLEYGSFQRLGIALISLATLISRAKINPRTSGAIVFLVGFNLRRPTEKLRHRVLA